MPLKSPARFFLWKLCLLNFCLCTLFSSGIDPFAAPVQARKPLIVDRVAEEQQDKINAKLKDTAAQAHYRNADDYVSSRILIKAPVDVVWKMVHEERESAPSLVYSKLHKEEAGMLVLEQKWTIIPFVKSTTCVIGEKEILNSRIDYRVLKSNQFKSMEGAWIFTPSADQKTTELELTCHMELRGLAPKKMVNVMARNKIAQRLAHIKELAEKPHANLDVGGRIIR